MVHMENQYQNLYKSIECHFKKYQVKFNVELEEINKN